MSDLTLPRFQTALAELPGDPRIWELLLHESDRFAYETANAGKGGPFGAMLALVNPNFNQYILVGNAESAQDSNAVVSKGLASAHAEAENLSPEKREMLIRFLEENKNQGWEVVQISSGESCPSCRSKQIVLANELIQRGLIDAGRFHVLFKATYDQTYADAGFNDAPFDQTFRAITALNVLDQPDGLLSLELALNEDPAATRQIKSGELVYNAVKAVENEDIPADVKAIFEQAGDQPVAVVVSQDGQIMSHGLDEREGSDAINHPEKTAIVRALHQAAHKLRHEEGKLESWNLEGATLYTNIKDMGPLAYAETLWYSLSGIKFTADYNSDVVENMAQEVPGLDNRALFRQVAADYNDQQCPLNVAFGGDPDVASVAHLLWRARKVKEALLQRQAESLSMTQDLSDVQISFFDGSPPVALGEFVAHSGENTHYDGKQGPQPDGP